jgi:hypothetical protein
MTMAGIAICRGAGGKRLLEELVDLVPFPAVAGLPSNGLLIQNSGWTFPNAAAPGCSMMSLQPMTFRTRP